MKNPLSMLYEKRDGRDEWSMTRVAVLAFTAVYLAVLVMLARRGVQVGWPMSMLGIAVLFAIPFKDLFSIARQVH
jgi:hypothetical protein